MLLLYQKWSWWVGETGIVKIFRVEEMGIGEMGIGKMGQIIGETGVGEMGVILLVQGKTHPCSVSPMSQK